MFDTPPARGLRHVDTPPNGGFDIALFVSYPSRVWPSGWDVKLRLLLLFSGGKYVLQINVPVPTMEQSSFELYTYRPTRNTNCFVGST